MHPTGDVWTYSDSAMVPLSVATASECKRFLLGGLDDSW